MNLKLARKYSGTDVKSNIFPKMRVHTRKTNLLVLVSYGRGSFLQLSDIFVNED